MSQTQFINLGIFGPKGSGVTSLCHTITSLYPNRDEEGYFEVLGQRVSISEGYDSQTTVACLVVEPLPHKELNRFVFQKQLCEEHGIRYYLKTEILQAYPCWFVSPKRIV
jgi:ABC-type multidrug transport system ATPase subunit